MSSPERTSTRVAVGLSESIDPVEAAAAAADQAASSLAEACDLCVVFASGPHLPMAKWVLSEVQERLAPAHLIGCGAGGTVASGREFEEGPSLVVWAASLPRAEIETLHLTVAREGSGFRLLGLPAELAEGEREGVLLLLADPYSFPAEALLDALAQTSPGLPVLGGLASAAIGGGGVLLRDGDVLSEGAVGAVLSGTEVLACVSQGAEPVGPEMTVTAAEGHLIRELASRPALARIGEVIESLGDEDRELARRGVLLGMTIDENRPEHERGDFLVRPIAGADRETGAITIGAPMRVGQTVRLHVRDAGSADEDLREALRAQSQALGSDGAAGALLFTCNGRGSHMFDLADHDAAAVEDALGVPAAGFFCAGEIGPVGGRNFVHGFTATAAIFPAG